MKKGKYSFYCRYIKRVIDFICALVAMIVFCWLYAIVAILVRIKLGSPVIFEQERIGKNEKPFTMFKFRSMSDARDGNDVLLPDADRITRFGHFLRSASLDEIPELFNVLRGDMSLIGPRPLPDTYLPFYTEHERQRHLISGGITGLAQVKSRNSTSWENRFSDDLDYVNNVSFLLDVQILFQTSARVLGRKGIGLRGVSSPEDFHIYRNH